MTRNRFWPCVMIFGLIAPAFAQFKVERIGNEQFFQRGRKLTFYSNTHFNRVEALQLNFGARYTPSLSGGFSMYGDLGYGFKNEKNRRWRWNTGLQNRFPNQLNVGVNYFNRVESNDDWLVNGFENSLAGIFLHEDFMDYFEKRGVRAFGDYRFSQAHTLRFEAGGHRYDPLARNTNWSLFGRKKDYAANTRTPYPVVAGEELAFRLTAVGDWRDNPIFPISGWYGDAQIEVTRQDFETAAFFLTLKRYQPTIGDQKFQIKLLAGARTGSFAYQHLLPMGGVGNLRGYNEKEFIGNRALYATANYIVGQQWLRHLPLNYIPIWDAISLGIFAETGYAWIADPTNAKAGLFDFGDFELNDLRSDVGFSIFFAENLLRVDFARRTDRGDDNWRILFRILDKF